MASRASVIIATGGCDNIDCLTLKVQESVQLYSSTLRPLGFAVVTAIAPTGNPGNISGPSQQQTFVRASYRLGVRQLHVQ